MGLTEEGAFTGILKGERASVDQVRYIYLYICMYVYIYTYIYNIYMHTRTYVHV